MGTVPGCSQNGSGGDGCPIDQMGKMIMAIMTASRSREQDSHSEMREGSRPIEFPEILPQRHLLRREKKERKKKKKQPKPQVPGRRMSWGQKTAFI